MEEAKHVFLTCPVIKKVWENIHIWMGIASNNGIDYYSHFEIMLANMQGFVKLKE